MEGIISNYRSGAHTQYPNQMIIIINSVKSKDEASKLVDKRVVWKSPKGKKIAGKVRKAHGNRGAVRVIFEKGLPGQALGNKVEIM